MDGILIVNKEKNMTSRDVVNKVSKILGTKKIGHTGTLDPMAEGVLVLAIGKCLKIVDDLTALNKEYEAEITLGIETDTLDITGNIIKEENKKIDADVLDKVLKSFIGKYDMQVPIYSAIKVNGKKLYEYARNNEEVKLPIKEVYINDLKRISDIKDNKFLITCDVSKGTYIRSLIRDIGKELNIPCTMSKLVRLKQGKFDIKNSYSLSEIEKNEYKLLTMEECIDLPIIEIDDFLYNKVKHGSKLQNRYEYDKFCFMYNKKVVAIYIVDKEKELVKPKKVFVD